MTDDGQGRRSPVEGQLDANMMTGIVLLVAVLCFLGMRNDFIRSRVSLPVPATRIPCTSSFCE